MRNHDKTHGLRQRMAGRFGIAATCIALLAASPALAEDAVANHNHSRVVELDMQASKKLLNPDSAASGLKPFFLVICERAAASCQKQLDAAESAAENLEGVKDVDFYHLDPAKESRAYDGVYAALDERVPGHVPQSFPFNVLMTVDHDGLHLVATAPDTMPANAIIEAIHAGLKAASATKEKSPNKPM